MLSRPLLAEAPYRFTKAHKKAMILSLAKQCSRGEITEQAYAESIVKVQALHAEEVDDEAEEAAAALKASEDAVANAADAAAKAEQAATDLLAQEERESIADKTLERICTSKRGRRVVTSSSSPLKRSRSRRRRADDDAKSIASSVAETEFSVTSALGRTDLSQARAQPLGATAADATDHAPWSTVSRDGKARCATTATADARAVVGGGSAAAGASRDMDGLDEDEELQLALALSASEADLLPAAAGTSHEGERVRWGDYEDDDELPPPDLKAVAPPLLLTSSRPASSSSC